MTSIHAFLASGGDTVELGELFSAVRRGRVVSSFAYDPAYLADTHAYAIEPALPLGSGAFPVAGALPRSFADAAPDRWGRNLITKRLAQLDVQAGRSPRTPDDRDFLLGVSDVTRQGALRFSMSSEGEFLGEDADVPTLIELPRLLRAAERVASDASDLEAVKELLDAGTGSLGGARPKASVTDGARLLIAKFPHPNDEWDVMGWEKLGLDLAAEAGIDVPSSSVVSIEGKTVLLIDRFDRISSRRIGYISALTLLEAADGEPRDYLDIAESISEHGSRVSADLAQLWRRMVFSAAIHNTDDHLRNHGFLRGSGGWYLSPAFDLNPNPSPSASRVTAFGGVTSLPGEAAVLLEIAEFFGLARAESRDAMVAVVEVVSNWRDVAASLGLAGEIARFEPALDRSLRALGDAVG